MNSYLGLYLLTRLDIIGLVSGLTLFFGGCAFVILYIAIKVLEDEGDDVTVYKKFKNILIIPVILSLILTISLPNKREAILIVAGGKTIDFIQKDSSINKIPAQTTAVISEFLDNQLLKLENDSIK